MQRAHIVIVVTITQKITHENNYINSFHINNCIRIESNIKVGYFDGSRTVCAPKRDDGLSLITESAVPGRCKQMNTMNYE